MSDKGVWDGDEEQTVGQDAFNDQDGSAPEFDSENGNKDVDDVMAKPQKSKLPFILAGVGALVGLGVAGTLIMSVLGPTKPKTETAAMSSALSGVSDQNQTPIQSGSLPGGLGLETPPSAQSPTAIPAMAAVSEPVAPQMQVPQMQVPVVAQPQVVASQVAAPAVAVAQVAQPPAKPVVVEPAKAVIKEEPPVKKVRPARSERVKATSTSRQAVASSNVKKKSHKAEKEVAVAKVEVDSGKKEEIISRSARLNGYKIFAISPAAGEFQVGYITNAANKIQIVRAGDSLDGHKVIRVDANTWSIVTSGGEVR